MVAQVPRARVCTAEAAPGTPAQASQPHSATSTRRRKAPKLAQCTRSFSAVPSLLSRGSYVERDFLHPTEGTSSWPRQAYSTTSTLLDNIHRQGTPHRHGSVGL